MLLGYVKRLTGVRAPVDPIRAHQKAHYYQYINEWLDEGVILTKILSANTAVRQFWLRHRARY